MPEEERGDTTRVKKQRRFREHHCIRGQKSGPILKLVVNCLSLVLGEFASQGIFTIRGEPYGVKPNSTDSHDYSHASTCEDVGPRMYPSMDRQKKDNLY
jgi:hypothetical protein